MLQSNKTLNSVSLCIWFVNKSNPQAAKLSLDGGYSGKILGIDKDNNARDEAYALKSMILVLNTTARKCTDGSRLKPHVRSLVLNLRKSVCLTTVVVCFE